MDELQKTMPIGNERWKTVISKKVFMLPVQCMK